MPPSNYLSKAISEIHVHIVIFITSIQPSTGSHTNKPSKHLASQSLTPPTNHSQAKYIFTTHVHLHYYFALFLVFTTYVPLHSCCNSAYPSLSTHAISKLVFIFMHLVTSASICVCHLQLHCSYACWYSFCSFVAIEGPCAHYLGGVHSCAKPAALWCKSGLCPHTWHTSSPVQSHPWFTECSPKILYSTGCPMETSHLIQGMVMCSLALHPTWYRHSW